MIRFLIKTSFAMIAVIALLVSPVWAKDPIYKSFLSNSALSGYDAVAYFKEGKSVKGHSTFTSEYQGANWLFSSEENLIAFKTDPQKFAPQYGGYCAWAVSQGYTAKGDPRHWSIHNDKLYLNYNADIQEKWLKAKENHIAKADKNWPSVLNE